MKTSIAVLRNTIWTLLFALISYNSFSQIYPVQSTPQLIPPYSVYLSDYAGPGVEKLRVILLQRDLTQASYQLRLVMSVELNGKIIMRTSQSFRPAPITLSPGLPTSISGAELAPYLDSRNIDFVGYSREQYERTKALPEGSYQLIFTAYDYHRQDIQVSNHGGSFYYLMKGEPPLINFPACGVKIPMRTPQQILFSWLPRNTASPNSAAETQYELSLYEIRPAGRNPNDIVQTTPPVFTTTTDVTQYFYGPADPMLLENMTYAWRVRAIDRSGKDAFRNNGFSEVCTFTCGVGADINIGTVQDIHAEAEAERRGRVWWTRGEFDGYRVNYRKVGDGYEWFSEQVTTAALIKEGKKEGEVKLFDLEPDTEYETRVQGKVKEYYGGYSDIIKFRTPPHAVPDCGDDAPLPFGDMTKPSSIILPGFIIHIDDMDAILVSVTPLGDGWYSGTGKMLVDFLGKAPFPIKFDRLFIDENRVAGVGKVEYVTRGVAELIEQQTQNAAQNQQQRTQQENRDAWADTEFYGDVFIYDVLIDTITVEGIGYLNITDDAGNITVNAEIIQVILAYPDKAIIIEDKSGDQYVVQKDKVTGQVKVTKVVGGGLPPVSNTPVTQGEIDLLKKVLKELKNDYSDSKLSMLQSEYTTSEKALTDYRDQIRSEFVSSNTTTSSTSADGDALVLTKTEVIQAGSDEFSTVSVGYKRSERNYNVGKVIRLLSRETNTEEERIIIIQNIRIANIAFGEYVTKRKSEGATEEQLKTEIKQEIILTVTNVLQNKY